MIFAPLALSYVPLITFDGTPATTHKFTVENDPVMGGLSTSAWNLTTDASGVAVGQFSGVCRIVPSLQAPGFVFALTGSQLTAEFPDASAEDGLVLKMANVAGNITAYKVAFCDSRVNPYRCQFGTYKADMTLKPASASAQPQTIFVPWSNFSDKWSASTGEPTKADPPTTSSLKSITQMQVWVEGVAGDFKTNIYEIGAGSAADATTATVEAL